VPMHNPTNRLETLFRSYPNAPGFKALGPSAEAAKAITAPAGALRTRVLECLKAAPAGMTADEIAAQLGCSILSVRPRVAELHRLGQIEQTGARRKNASGMTATVWRFAVRRGFEPGGAHG
jgi:IclR helix-turn-helix domain